MRQVLTVFRLLEVISNFEDEACRRFGCRFAGRVLQALLRHCAVETLLPISPVSDVSLAGSRPRREARRHWTSGARRRQLFLLRRSRQRSRKVNCAGPVMLLQDRVAQAAFFASIAITWTRLAWES